MIIIGVDNGVTSQGIGINICRSHNETCVEGGCRYGQPCDNEVRLIELPTRKTRDYQKEETYIRRIDVPLLVQALRPYRDPDVVMDDKGEILKSNTIALLERPMVNSRQFWATWSAARSFEAWLIALEVSKIPYEIIDSKHWQPKMLPKSSIEVFNTKLKNSRSQALKKASRNVSKAYWPHLPIQADGDGLLISVHRCSCFNPVSIQTKVLTLVTTPACSRRTP